MSTDRLNVTFNCRKCGAKEITVKDPSDENSPVTFKGYGFRFGTWKEVKEVATKAGTEELENIARNIFKK